MANRDENSMWSIFGYLLSGLIFWGGVGYGLDKWLDKGIFTLIGLLVLLTWNLRGVAQQTSNLQIAKAQLGQATFQSAQTEEKLKAMLTDLLALAATEKDPDAAAIVKRYGIKQHK